MKRFKEYRQDKNFLFPRSLDEFVPQDHEVHWDAAGESVIGG